MSDRYAQDFETLRIVGSSFIIRVEEQGTYDAMAVLDRNKQGLPQVEERGLDVEGEITWTINAP
jgi:hypothetical protein